jgi:hypothetical protein
MLQKKTASVSGFQGAAATPASSRTEWAFFIKESADFRSDAAQGNPYPKNVLQEVPL